MLTDRVVSSPLFQLLGRHAPVPLKKNISFKTGADQTSLHLKVYGTKESKLRAQIDYAHII